MYVVHVGNGVVLRRDQCEGVLRVRIRIVENNRRGVLRAVVGEDLGQTVDEGIDGFLGDGGLISQCELRREIPLAGSNRVGAGVVVALDAGAVSAYSKPSHGFIIAAAC